MKLLSNFSRSHMILISKSELKPRSQYVKEMSLGRRNNEIKVVGTCKFRVRRVKVGKIENKKKLSRPKPPSCLCPFHHNFASFSGVEPLISSTRHHLIFLFFIPLLIALLQVDYQSKNVSPFNTHLINMWGYLAATFVYCVGLGTNLELQAHPTNYSKMVSHVILSLGGLASVSFASVLFQCLIGWIILCLWTVLPIALAIYVGRVRFKRFWEFLALKKQHVPNTIISAIFCLAFILQESS